MSKKIEKALSWSPFWEAELRENRIDRSNKKQIFSQMFVVWFIFAMSCFLSFVYLRLYTYPMVLEMAPVNAGGLIFLAVIIFFAVAAAFFTVIVTSSTLEVGCVSYTTFLACIVSHLNLLFYVIAVVLICCYTIAFLTQGLIGQVLFALKQEKTICIVDEYCRILAPSTCGTDPLSLEGEVFTSSLLGVGCDEIGSFTCYTDCDTAASYLSTPIEVNEIPLILTSIYILIGWLAALYFKFHFSKFSKRFDEKKGTFLFTIFCFLLPMFLLTVTSMYVYSNTGFSNEKCGAVKRVETTSNKCVGGHKNNQLSQLVYLIQVPQSIFNQTKRKYTLAQTDCRQDTTLTDRIRNGCYISSSGSEIKLSQLLDSGVEFGIFYYSFCICVYLFAQFLWAREDAPEDTSAEDMIIINEPSSESCGPPLESYEPPLSDSFDQVGVPPVCVPPSESSVPSGRLSDSISHMPGLVIQPHHMGRASEPPPLNPFRLQREGMHPLCVPPSESPVSSGVLQPPYPISNSSFNEGLYPTSHMGRSLGLSTHHVELAPSRSSSFNNPSLSQSVDSLHLQQPYDENPLPRVSDYPELAPPVRRVREFSFRNPPHC